MQPTLVLKTLVIAVLLSACYESPRQGRTYVATIHPVAAILEEVVGDRAEVVRLLAPGASPHTYNPSPREVATVHGAEALFYVSDALDGWAASIESGTQVALLDFVGESDRLRWLAGEHGSDHVDFNPHFWLDPLAVKNATWPLVERLSEIDPEGVSVYEENANRFVGELNAVHVQLTELLKGSEGRSMIVFHPSMDYFLQRYGIEVVGVIEQTPGTEPSARDIAELAERAREADAVAVLSEPQLPEAPARIVAETAGLPVVEVDPVGGVQGRMSYTELLLFNGRALAEAIE